MIFKKSSIGVIIILVGMVTIIGLSGFDSLFSAKPNQSVNIPTGQNPSVALGMEKISLTANDKVKIAADLYAVQNAIGWLVLVHMMPATKESFSDVAQRFQNIGYGSLAIDLRGHGESDGGPNGYLKFSDSEHQKSVFDLDAAINYLIQDEGAAPDKIIFIGASIGANLSLKYISQYPEYKTAILLSAGLDYHGIETEPLVKNLKAGQKVFFISAKDDDDDANQNQQLFDLTSNNLFKKIKIYDTGGHGTDLFASHPDLISLILDFINAKTQS